METQVIVVENIKCGGCMHTIKTALLKIDKVEDVQIELETETITIKGNANRELLVEKLAHLGYPEQGNNSLLLKAKSFVSCAVGKINS